MPLLFHCQKDAEKLNSSAVQHWTQPICDSDFLKMNFTNSTWPRPILRECCFLPTAPDKNQPKTSNTVQHSLSKLIAALVLTCISTRNEAVILGLSFLQSIKAVVGRGLSTYHKTEGGIRCSSLQVALLSQGRRLR